MMRPHMVKSDNVWIRYSDVIYVNSQPGFFIIASKNANAILKIYEAVACFTLVGPQEH